MTKVDELTEPAATAMPMTMGCVERAPIANMRKLAARRDKTPMVTSRIAYADTAIQVKDDSGIWCGRAYARARPVGKGRSVPLAILARMFAFRALAVSALLLSACGAPPTAQNAPAPPFDLPNLAGGKTSLASFKIGRASRRER